MGAFEDLPKFVKERLRDKAVNVQPIGRQPGSERFPVLRQKYHNLTADRDELPPIKEWRLNLTALSKVYNLYFVAYSDRIYVYRPNFPNQSLSLKPAIILNPRKTSEAGGYIDPIDPHSINNVVIDFLGNLEVILVACDDGDVIGYYTHKIEDTISRLSTEEEKDEDEKDLSFFAVNVELSAWGLSIHSRARKIAISSNTTCVTIYALGLVCPSDPWTLPRPVPEDLSEWHRSVLNDPKWRGDDQKVLFGKWGQNIPSVAFCNNDEDMEGRLLAFGGIKGNIYIIDLHKLKPVESVRIGFCGWLSEHAKCPCREDQYAHAIWGLSWLDRKAFHIVSRQMSPSELSNDFSRAWNGTYKKLTIPDANSRGCMSFWPSKTMNSATDQPPPQYILPQVVDADEAAYSSGIENAWSEKETTPKKGMKSSTTTTSDVCDALDLKWKPDIRHSHRVPQALDIRMRNMDGDSNPKIFSFEEIAQPEPYYRDANYPCPLFVASKSDACLVQPKDHMNEVEPIIGYLKPTEQCAFMNDDMRQAPWFHYDEPMDRLSLQAHIPELGVVVVGTPKGRIAVFTLCQSNDKNDGSPVYFHRLDWILPLESQEQNGDRPLAKLIGIAAGPIQGHLGIWDGVKSRKWRLMLHYGDHTILSYELAKEDEEVIWKDGPSPELYRKKERTRRNLEKLGMSEWK